MSWLPLNAAFGRRLVPFFVRLGVTAHQVTFLSLAAGLIGAAAFLRAGRTGMVFGAAGFLAANVLDECDGALSRATGTSSGFGSWLDTVAGCLIHMVFFGAMGLSFRRQFGQPEWAVLGGIAALGVLVSTTVFVVSQSLVRGKEGLRHPDPPRSTRTGRLEFLKGMLRTDFSLVVLAAAGLGFLPWILWGVAVGTFFFWIPSDLWKTVHAIRGQPL